MKCSLSDLISPKGILTDGDWVESKDQDPEGDVRLIQLADVGDGYFVNKSSRFLTSDKARELRCTFLRKGDILIARMPDPLGRACIFPELDQPAVTVVDVAVVRPNNDQIFSPWLCHLLNSPSFRNEITNWSSGTTRNRISRKNLDKIRFEVPPLDEQKRIAAILDKADQLRQKRRQAIALLDSLTQSIFLEMFGEHDPMGNDSTLLGIADIQIGYPFKSERYTEASDGIKLCRGANILPNKLDWSDLAKWPLDQADNHTEFALEENDIVVAMDRPWISTGFKIASITSDDLPALLVQRVARIRAKKKSDAYFIYELMRGSAFTRHCRPTETTIPHISPKDFRSFEFNSGRDSDRLAFSGRAQHIYATKDKLEQQMKTIESLFASLQHRAFSGQL